MAIERAVVLAQVVWASAFSQSVDTARHLTLYAFGDVNLGRSLGQRLLKGEIDYPFQEVRTMFSHADIVFANLESPLSDQGGRTEDPKSNVVFCGPPNGATALRRGSISVVSTANNHAFDFGMKGIKETVEFLRAENIEFAGTSETQDSLFAPAILVRNGIRIGILAYTQSVNIDGPWVGHISVYDAARAEQEIRELRLNADFVLVSYHAGREYADTPDEKTVLQMRALIDEGADMVLGHHPHVPQGIEEYKNKLIIYSLGNLIFYQPQHSWAQLSYGLDIGIVKQSDRASVQSVRLIPVRVSMQPKFNLEKSEILRLAKRVKKLSSASILVDGERISVQIAPFVAGN